MQFTVTVKYFRALKGCVLFCYVPFMDVVLPKILDPSQLSSCFHVVNKKCNVCESVLVSFSRTLFHFIKTLRISTQGIYT